MRFIVPELSFALIITTTPWPVSANASIRASKPSSRPLWLERARRRRCRRARGRDQSRRFCAVSCCRSSPVERTLFDGPRATAGPRSQIARQIGWRRPQTSGRHFRIDVPLPEHAAPIRRNSRTRCRAARSAAAAAGSARVMPTARAPAVCYVRERTLPVTSTTSCCITVVAARPSTARELPGTTSTRTGAVFARAVQDLHDGTACVPDVIAGKPVHREPGGMAQQPAGVTFSVCVSALPGILQVFSFVFTSSSSDERAELDELQRRRRRDRAC